jgi:spore maturation protein SpmA
MRDITAHVATVALVALGLLFVGVPVMWRGLVMVAKVVGLLVLLSLLAEMLAR